MRRNIRTRILLLTIFIVTATGVILGVTYRTTLPQTQVIEPAKGEEVTLPNPVTVGTVSVEEALERRASIRNYTDQPITIQQVSQLLWAAQGITRPS